MRLIRPGLIVLCLLAAALAEAKPASAAESIRIGYLGPLTGIFAQAGKDMLDGLKLSLEQINYQAGGRKIELIEEDTEGNSATAIAKYRKLVGHDKIHVLTGVLLVNVGNSLVPLIEKDQLPTLFLTTPDDLTKRKIAKWILRSNFSASQIMHPLGDYAAKTLKYKKVAVIAMDNGFGHGEAGGFQRVFEDAGGRVVQKIWVPLNVLDFAPYLSQVAKDVDAVCAVFVAGQAVRFVKQYGEAGLKGKTPLIGTGVMIDESALRGMGDEAVGTIGTLLWSPTLQTPANQTFMKLAEGKLGRTPAYFHAIMYSSGRWITEAANALNGQVEDREKLVAAIRRAIETTPDPRGPIKLADWGNPTENVYVLRVDRAAGRRVHRFTPIRPCRSSGPTGRRSSSRARPTRATIPRSSRSAPMRFGFFFWPYTPEYTARLARLGEDLGFDLVGIADTPGNALDPWVAMTLAAAATSRVRLTTCVTNLVTRHPSITASAAASVDAAAAGAHPGHRRRAQRRRQRGRRAHPRNRAGRGPAFPERASGVPASWRGAPLTRRWRPVPVYAAASGPAALRAAARSRRRVRESARRRRGGPVRGLIAEGAVAAGRPASAVDVWSIAC
jgi:branched-chain amino acid transport system substrate-binding protein